MPIVTITGTDELKPSVARLSGSTSASDCRPEPYRRRR
jgi:hypothetical protein